MRGPRGGYSPEERDALPARAFLKPETRSWPVSDRRHALIALQYMVRGFGNRADYPRLLSRLAEIYPPENPANREIWSFYRKHLGPSKSRQNPGRNRKTMDVRTTLRLDFSEYPGAEVEFSIPVSAPARLRPGEVVLGTMILLLDQLGFGQVGYLNVVSATDENTGERQTLTPLYSQWHDLLDKQQQMAPRERAGYLNVLRQTLRLRPFAVKNPRRRTARGRA